MGDARSERLLVAPAARHWRIPVYVVEACASFVDLVVVVSASLLAGTLFHLFVYGYPGSLDDFLVLGLVVSALLVPVKLFRGQYKPIELLDLRHQFVQLISEWTLIFVSLTGIAFALKAGASFSRGATLSFALAGLGALLATRLVWRSVLRFAIENGHLRGRRIALIGPSSASNDRQLSQILRKQGYEIAAFVEEPDCDAYDIGSWRQFFRRINSEICVSGIEEVLIHLEFERARSLIAAFETLRVVPLPVYIIPDLETAKVLMKRSRPFGSSIAIEVQRAPLNGAERATKRAIDIVLACISLALLMPLFVCVAVAVRIDSPGPILFRQTRLGFNGRPFKILKFRTMTVMEDGDVVVQARRTDRRVTRVGRFLRSSSIDELPQLINVLIGDMSFVGPRPHAVAHDTYYTQLIANYALRHHVRPGLTGWAQVNGFRGETPTVDLMARRVELDLWYVDNWTLWLDVKIIVRTFAVLLRNPRAY